MARQKGTAERTERLDIRCIPELITVLDAIIKESWAYGNNNSCYSRSDIIHFAIREVANGQFPGARPELEAALDRLDDEANRVSF